LNRLFKTCLNINSNYKEEQRSLKTNFRYLTSRLGCFWNRKRSSCSLDQGKR